MGKTIARLLSIPFPGRTLIANALGFYSLQSLGYVFPVILIPFFSRVLGPAGFGLLAFSQGFAQLVQLGVEYGFHLSATRDLARDRDLREARQRVLSEVTAAKVLLLLASAVALFVIHPVIPRLGSQRLLLWSALIWMTGQAFSMGWFYNAIEDLRPALFADLSANTVSTLAIVLLVRTPADVWKVLAIQGVAFTAAALVALWWAARTSGFARPSWRSLKARLRTGRAVFGYRAALASYSVGNAFLLGCLAPAAQVGYFSAAERLVRALIALSYPIAQALYPRVHYHAGRRDEKAHQLAKLGLAACAVIGVLCGSIAVSAAPWFLPRILGSGFGSSLEIFRILALLCPLVAVNTVLAFQWLLPRFLDASLTGITIAAGVINVGAAFFVVPRYGALGMACTVVAAEVFVLAGCLLSLWKYGDAESSIQARTNASI